MFEIERADDRNVDGRRFAGYLAWVDRLSSSQRLSWVKPTGVGRCRRSWRRPSLVLGFAIELLAVLSAPAFAATISGTVTDETTGAPVTDGFAQVRDELGNGTNYSNFNSDGTYTVNQLPPGTYKLLRLPVRQPHRGVVSLARNDSCSGDLVNRGPGDQRHEPGRGEVLARGDHLEVTFSTVPVMQEGSFRIWAYAGGDWYEIPSARYQPTCRTRRPTASPGP